MTIQQTFFRISDLASTKERTGRLPLHPNTIWRLVRLGEFPAPVKLAPNITAWPKQAIEDWEKARCLAVFPGLR